MPRRLRLQFPGVPLHVIQRGNNRDNCFFRDEDRVAYLGLLEQLAAEHDCSVHAYVLMPNHVHLLMTPQGERGVSRLMKDLGQRFAQLMNRNHRRTGSLWEGRFRSSLIDSQGYLLRCHRYIELNPVRASMVVAPHLFPWSSFKANAWGVTSPVVTPHPVYRSLGAHAFARAREYVKIFDEPVSETEIQQIRDAVNGGFPWGSDAFVEELEARMGKPMTRRRVPTSSCVGRLEKADQVV